MGFLGALGPAVRLTIALQEQLHVLSPEPSLLPKEFIWSWVSRCASLLAGEAGSVLSSGLKQDSRLRQKLVVEVPPPVP